MKDDTAGDSSTFEPATDWERLRRLDDAVVHVKAGDVVVQQATNHAWINRSKEPCRIIFVLMDSKQP